MVIIAWKSIMVLFLSINTGNSARCRPRPPFPLSSPSSADRRHPPRTAEPPPQLPGFAISVSIIVVLCNFRLCLMLVSPSGLSYHYPYTYTLAQQRPERSLNLSKLSSVSLADRIPTNRPLDNTSGHYPYLSFEHLDLSEPWGHLVRGVLKVISDDDDDDTESICTHCM